MKHSSVKLIFSFLVLCILINNCSCKKPNEVVVHIDKEEFTIEDQQQIGINLSKLIENTSVYYQILDRTAYADVYTYINTIFNSIVNTNFVENRTTFDWEVIILEDDRMYSAFAIPGGKIYIYTGLLKILEGEHELFSILSHELYYTDKAVIINAMIGEYGTLVLGDLVLGTNSTGAIEIAETVHDISYIESEVSKADSFMLEVICPFDYEALGFISFIERATLMPEEIKWFVTHPSPSDRLNIIENIIDSNTEDCGSEEQTFSDRYTTYKNMLP